MKKYAFKEKSIEELVAEANKHLENVIKMTEEEEIEDDAEYGYFQNEDE